MLMKKIICLLLLLGIPSLAHASGIDTGIALPALWLTALTTAIVHTVAGPDHYLPFIAIAKARDYSLKKTLAWTFVCGLGHIGSALLIALAFIYFSHWLSASRFTWLEDNRSDLAAYTMIGLGAAYLLWALRHRLLHKNGMAHNHFPKDAQNKNITVWVLFIIFVLGPCEALLPILTASSVIGSAAVISSTIVFSVATIATMMIAVSSGLLGLKILPLSGFEKYAHEIAGTTIMACGAAIICGL